MYPSLPMIGKRQCELAVLTSSVNNDYCRSTVMMGGVKGQCQAVAKLCKDTVPASIFIIVLPWGDVNAPIEFVVLKW